MTTSDEPGSPGMVRVSDGSNVTWAGAPETKPWATPFATPFVTLDDLPRVIAEALDAADKRREERAQRQQATQNLEAMRQKFAGQLEVLKRVGSDALALETRDLLDLIDEKLAKEVAANADMIRESILQARAALDPPKLELLPGAQLIREHGKRR